MASVSVVKCMEAPKYGGSELGRSSHLLDLAARSHRVSMTAVHPPKAKEVEKGKNHFRIHEVHEQDLHSMPPQKVEIFKSLEGCVGSGFTLRGRSGGV